MKPLAYILRPEKIEDIIGQEHLFGANKPLRKLIDSKIPTSLIFYGPPGCGKTTTATIIANTFNLNVINTNATQISKKNITDAIELAKLAPIILVIDEIHRLNKDKQELLLPDLENGNIFLLGMTTVNPYHSVNKAIRSRCHLFGFKEISGEHIFTRLQKICFEQNIIISDENLKNLATSCNGDFRMAINIISFLSGIYEEITKEVLENYFTHPIISYDTNQDDFYNLLSALQKSIRGSDVNASLYYLAKFCICEDLEALERRLIVIAYEDIGLANPDACSRTVIALEASKKIGFPEAIMPLSVIVVDLALSPKSKTAYKALKNAIEFSKESDYFIPDLVKLNHESTYDYNNLEGWQNDYYLPEAIKEKEFISFEDLRTGKYEKGLQKMYEYYKQLKENNK